MPGPLGPIEVACDAPPYPVVHACGRLGFRSPLDVPWYHRAHYLRGHGQEAFGAAAWKLVFGRRRAGKACPCGLPLPDLLRYTFTFTSGRQADYLLGQCFRCRAIFWEEA